MWKVNVVKRMSQLGYRCSHFDLRYMCACVRVYIYTVFPKKYFWLWAGGRLGLGGGDEHFANDRLIQTAHSGKPSMPKMMSFGCCKVDIHLFCTTWAM